MSIIVLYIIYISLTIIKCYVLTCFDNNKITGAFRPKVGHCDFPVGALRLRDWGIATRFGAFRSWGIQAVGHCDYNSIFPQNKMLCNS